ncbi:urease accessory protein UreF [Parafrankia sp. EUN1f]|uniref:urease accessory protein UreF n=1 Tax=Parafrankia sp. EUN1f TaxID=102897 RepID=UPI0001C44B2B|nr:urease accessory UreF family protein [Parafrankia sp. EUN1f]EFC82427.1 Urease accessory protein UreF-like protein [Parafrankia sp. EUN1f]
MNADPTTTGHVEARAALLLLADGRLPAGGHAHSGGVEAAVLGGDITGLDDLAEFLRGRLATAGLLAASFAAGVCRAVHAAASAASAAAAASANPASPAGPASPAEPAHAAGTKGVPLLDVLAAFDDEVDARTPSPAQRAASRAQGRALMRVARAAWPVPIQPSSPHHCVALGLVAAAAGLEPRDAALAAAHASVNGPATAAVRLLGLDPLAVTGLLAEIAASVDSTAFEADQASLGSPANLPAGSAPHLDLLSERHRTAQVRMFTS